MCAHRMSINITPCRKNSCALASERFVYCGRFWPPAPFLEQKVLHAYTSEHWYRHKGANSTVCALINIQTNQIHSRLCASPPYSDLFPMRWIIACFRTALSRATVRILKQICAHPTHAWMAPPATTQRMDTLVCVMPDTPAYIVTKVWIFLKFQCTVGKSSLDTLCLE